MCENHPHPCLLSTLKANLTPAYSHCNDTCSLYKAVHRMAESAVLEQFLESMLQPAIGDFPAIYQPLAAMQEKPLVAGDGLRLCKEVELTASLFPQNFRISPYTRFTESNRDVLVSAAGSLASPHFDTGLVAGCYQWG